MFAEHIERILDEYGVAPDTKAALYDLYVSLGDETLEVFAEIAEERDAVAELTPEDTQSIRARVVERYVRRSHPQWLEGRPTPSLWHPRVTEGRASGLAMPLGEIGEDVSADSFSGRLTAESRALIGDAQPFPSGILMLGRNAHYGGRQETVSFDVVASDVEDAVAAGLAAGQQHTMPGSIGETSATFDPTAKVALIWEVQPNVYKPLEDRNRAIAKLYRKHRNWHLVTLLAAIRWFQSQQCAIYILRGSALATTHEVNPEKPVSDDISSFHDRTVQRVAEAAGLTLSEPLIEDDNILRESIVMNHALRKHVLQYGAGDVMWRVS